MQIFYKIYNYCKSPPPKKRKALARSRAIRHYLAQIIFISFTFFFIACSSTQPQYVDSRDYTSFGLDNHDIDDKVQKIAKSLLNSRTIKNQKEQKVLAIGAIDDETSDDIDTEIIATELIKHLGDSEKFLVVNAGCDKKVEEMNAMQENCEKMPSIINTPQLSKAISSPHIMHSQAKSQSTQKA